MTKPADKLKTGLARLEKRLRHDWAQEAPPLSSELTSYKNEWLRTLNRPYRQATVQEVRTALLSADPVLLGDFHTMQRSRSSLAWLLRQVPSGTSPALMLELLPRCAAIPAAEALKDSKLKLVDGRLLKDVYSPSLRALAKRDGLIAGAWVDEGARQRDHSAAKDWQELCQKHPGHKWLLFFGDWHLADGHLPRALRRVGAKPQMLHQSPEPIWERQANQLDEQLIKISSNHWAWLHTPPLAHWASALQANHDGNHELAAELTEEIVETLIEEICDLFNLPLPSAKVCAWPEDQWESFLATLPAIERRGFISRKAPRGLIVHPHFPAIYTTSAPALNQLVEAAAHCIACDYPITNGEGFEQRLAARAWRRLPASLVNQFLTAPNLSESGTRILGLSEKTPIYGDWQGLLSAWKKGEDFSLDPAQQLIAIEVFGAQAGCALAKQERLDANFIKQILMNGFESLDWRALAATMLAA